MEYKMRNRNALLLKVVFFLIILIHYTPFAKAGTVAIYTYDKAGRLIGVDYSAGKYIAYKYDNAGNLLSRTVGNNAPGDVYADSLIDLKDAIMALKVASRLEAERALFRGDVNGDRKIGVEEAIYVLTCISEESN